MIKNLILLAGLLLAGSVSMTEAQSTLDINPKVDNGQILILDHDKAELSFDFVLEDSDYKLGTDQKPVQFSVCLMNAAIVQDIRAIQAKFPEFILNYNPDNDCLYGVQQTELIGDQSYQIKLPIEVPSVLELGIEQVGFLVNIQPAASMNGANDRNDDKLFELRSKQSLKTEYIQLIQDEIQPVVTDGDIAIDIQPNPSIERFGMKLSRPINDAQIYLYDVNGQLLIDQFFKVLDHNTIELNDIPSGRYELIVQSPSLINKLTKTVIISKK